jgi:hypothetical protein
LMEVVGNQTKIFEFQTVGLPLQYAKEVLDRNHDGTISVQEASEDLTFERIIGGNLSLILTQNLENGTKSPTSEYNIDNDTRINIETELRPVLMQKSKSFFRQHGKLHQIQRLEEMRVLIWKAVRPIRTHFLNLVQI